MDNVPMPEWLRELVEDHAITIEDVERLRACEEALRMLVNAIRRAVKHDPMMNGSDVLRGVDHVMWNRYVVVALELAATALSKETTP